LALAHGMLADAVPATIVHHPTRISTAGWLGTAGYKKSTWLLTKWTKLFLCTTICI